MAQKTRYKVFWFVPAASTRSGVNESGRMIVSAHSEKQAKILVRKEIRKTVGGHARFSKVEDTGW